MAILDIQRASETLDIPDDEHFKQWVECTISHSSDTPTSETELSIRIVDEPESQALNREYRQKDKPTNVLSFPADLPDVVDIPLLGDLVICAPVVIREANEQHKPAEAHWAHMVVHGVLHLMGYDHIEDDDAEVMEALEIQLLGKMGFDSPYEEAS